ncbi:MAG: DUF502 domain-containing protein [Planctomycetota bacterium]
MTENHNAPPDDVTPKPGSSDDLPIGENSPSTSILILIRNRIIAGLFVVLPIYITYAVLKWLYDTLYAMVLSPISRWLRGIWNIPENPVEPVNPADPGIGPAVDAIATTQPDSWILSAALAFAALFLACAVLYVAGMFFRSRLHQLVNWILLNVPGVSMIYSAVNKVFDAISSSRQDTKQFKRVVLVPFPHAGMKAPAFVTGECIEESTKQVILCVYVPTTPVPTSGYMLLIPQGEVVDLNWDLEETLQAIVSGGITVPNTVSYFRSLPTTTIDADSRETTESLSNDEVQNEEPSS